MERSRNKGYWFHVACTGLHCSGLVVLGVRLKDREEKGKISIHLSGLRQKEKAHLPLRLWITRYTSGKGARHGEYTQNGKKKLYGARHLKGVGIHAG